MTTSPTTFEDRLREWLLELVHGQWRALPGSRAVAGVGEHTTRRSLDGDERGIDGGEGESHALRHRGVTDVENLDAARIHGGVHVFIAGRHVPDLTVGGHR